MKLFKVTLAPLLGEDDKGDATRVGGWMCYVTSPHASSIGDVLRKCLPHLFTSAGIAAHDVDEEISPKLLRGCQAWSVSVGPEGRAQSFLVTCRDDQPLEAELKNVVAGLPSLVKYIEMGLWTARKINRKKAGVW